MRMRMGIKRRSIEERERKEMSVKKRWIGVLCIVVAESFFLKSRFKPKCDP
jgi:hypothetical protein